MAESRLNGLSIERTSLNLEDRRLATCQTIDIADFCEKSKVVNLHRDRLYTILQSRPEVMKLPTMVISIGGVTRSGKSFFLNLLINYLTYLEQKGHDKNWESSDLPIRGIEWKASKRAVTRGILMWDRPFIISIHDGSKAAVLLVDCQGTGDNRLGDVKMDTLIMCLSLRIATTQLLNVRGYLTSTEMNALELCADFTAMEGGKSKALFESLIILIRDYNGGPDLGEDKDAVKEMIESCENEELRRVIQGIQDAFNSITTYNLPHPGRNISSAEVESRVWNVKDVPDEFLKHFKSLAGKLCTKESDGNPLPCWKSGQELLRRFETLEFGELSLVMSPADALHDSIVLEFYLEATDDLRKCKAELTLVDHLKSFTTEDDLRDHCNHKIQSTMRKFQQSCKKKGMSHTAAKRKYENSLKGEVKLASQAVQAAFQLNKLRMEYKKEQRELEEEIKKLKAKIPGPKERYAARGAMILGPPGALIGAIYGAIKEEE